MDMQALKERARQLALGPEFQPREKEIETPPILLDKMPELADMLKLVGISAKGGIALKEAAKGEDAMMAALCICHALRFRDGTPYFAMTDAAALLEQDVELTNELGKVVMAFLGFGKGTLDDAKNGSGATQNSDGGGESPSTPDTTPLE